jgi:3alpha(or 20beta)-hydroxysteroid dehydrogenase
MRLAGKVVLITGAARGTGAEIARSFKNEGAELVLTDILDDPGEALADELQARYRHLDVTSESDWTTAIQGLDRLDVLVNNAAVLHLTSIENTTTDIFETVMRVNALGPFLGTKACLPLMRTNGGGSIVNIGSSDSVQGTPATVAYTCSKFALRGLAKVTALEGGKDNIRANIVCPRAGSAEMLTSLVGPPLDLGPGSVISAMPKIPLGRTKGPADVVGAVLFLASDESRYVTGTEIVVDGGATAGEYLDVPGQFSRET